MAKESKAQETTIVKATPKKVDSQKDEQPRGTVKAASISQVRTLGANKQVKHQTAQQERPAHRPPLGTPVVNKDLENRSKPPIGKPMGKPVVPKEVAERGKPSAEAEAAQAAEMPKAATGKTTDARSETAAPTVQPAPQSLRGVGASSCGPLPGQRAVCERNQNPSWENSAQF